MNSSALEEIGGGWPFATIHERFQTNMIDFFLFQNATFYDYEMISYTFPQIFVEAVAFIFFLFQM